MSNAHWLAWKEILAQVLEGFTAQENVSPPWLINPETGRRLSLDMLYPELGLAVHFRGAQPAAQRRRRSDQEVNAEERRERIRRDVCRSHGIILVSVDLRSEDPRRELDALHTALNRITRELAHSRRKDKLDLLEDLARARRKLAEIRSRLASPHALDLFAEKWRDRETRLIRETRRQVKPPASSARHYQVGMRVWHERFGEGRVVEVREEPNGDQQVVIDFPTGGRRTFLASLVGERLKVK